MNLVALKKTMPFHAVVHKGGLQAGFNTGDGALVDIAVGDLFSGTVDIKLLQAAVLDLGNAALFRVYRVNQYFTGHVSISLIFYEPMHMNKLIVQ